MTPSVPVPQAQAEPDLSPEFAELVLALQAEGGRLGALQTVCELAVKVIDVDDASVTVRHGDGFRTVAATGHVPEAIERIQCDTDEGPCMETVVKHQTFATGDLTQETRCPKYASRVTLETGVHSILSSPLLVREHTVGSLTVLARRRHAFDESDVGLFGVFAAHAAVTVQAAQAQSRVDNLEIALRNSRTIGTAVGILMHGRRVDEAAAFTLLRRRSQDSNRKLALIAHDVVRTGNL